jgi:hypothetical protein
MLPMVFESLAVLIIATNTQNTQYSGKKLSGSSFRNAPQRVW